MNVTESATLPSVVAYAYNPSTCQVEKGGSEVQSQFRLSETQRGDREGEERKERQGQREEGEKGGREGETNI